MLADTEVLLHYCFFLVRSEMAYSVGFGNHEGDWLALQFRIALVKRVILECIFHNHGRQLRIDAMHAIRGTLGGAPRPIEGKRLLSDSKLQGREMRHGPSTP